MKADLNQTKPNKPKDTVQTKMKSQLRAFELNTFNPVLSSFLYFFINLLPDLKYSRGNSKAIIMKSSHLSEVVIAPGMDLT